MVHRNDPSTTLIIVQTVVATPTTTAVQYCNRIDTQQQQQQQQQQPATVAVAVAARILLPPRTTTTTTTIRKPYHFAVGGSTMTHQLSRITSQIIQIPRGGSTTFFPDNDESDVDDENDDEMINLSSTSAVDDDAYTILAKAIQSRFVNNNNNNYSSNDDTNNSQPDIETLIRAFRILSSSHKALKGLDGAAHEAYQRTHQTKTTTKINRNKRGTRTTTKEDDDTTSRIDQQQLEMDLNVAGRVQRNADRTAIVASALGACELCELLANNPEQLDLSVTTTTKTNMKATNVNSTLYGREIVLNITNVTTIGKLNVNVLVLYESSYRGGSGIHHGSIEDLTNIDNNNNNYKTTEQLNIDKCIGRILVIIHDNLQNDLDQMFRILEQNPRSITMGYASSTSDMVQVQPSLYRAAGSVVQVIRPIIQSYSNSTAIHITGRVMSGGIAALAASILHGTIPIPSSSNVPKRQLNKLIKNNRNLKNDDDDEDDEDHFDITSIRGMGRNRVSAMVLGAPPCISSNVDIPFVKSILFGDDIIGRVSPDSLDRFYKRTRKAMEQKGIIGKKLNWMTDAASIATSNLQSHVFTSKDKLKALQVPGKAYLIRPRRLGNHCSIHEIGSQLQSRGREALRAAILWQLNDVVLSRSLWKHHQLESYIHGLDRVHLRGLDDTNSDD